MVESEAQERAYYRSPAKLVVRYGPDTPAGRHAMAINQEIWRTQAELETEARSILESESPDERLRPVIPVLKWLDFKLDLILSLIRRPDVEQHFPFEVFTTDISGSGFGLASSEQLETGKEILLELILPDRPARPVYAVGEVVRRESHPPGGATAAGISFLEISDMDRERIIRFTFRQQRRELAERGRGRI